MNYLQRTLAAAVIALSGCASHPRVLRPPAPEDTRIPNLPSPRTSLLSEHEAIHLYENALPDHIITNNNPNERTLEEAIHQQFQVHIQGDVDERTLEETRRILENIPAINPCPVYFVPDTLRGRDIGIGGWYTISQPFNIAHIVILKPVHGSIDLDDLRHALPHEFAHRRVHSLGENFLREWNALNTHQYGINLQDSPSGYCWRSEPHTGARYGFVSPYAAKNIHEDIASLVEEIRTQRPITFVDSETPTILEGKRQLIIRYNFIRQNEYLNAPRPAPETTNPQALAPGSVTQAETPATNSSTAYTLLSSCCILSLAAAASVATLALFGYARRRQQQA